MILGEAGGDSRTEGNLVEHKSIQQPLFFLHELPPSREPERITLPPLLIAAQLNRTSPQPKDDKEPVWTASPLSEKADDFRENKAHVLSLSLPSPPSTSS